MPPPARDTFSRKYLAGEVKIIPATFANPVKGESREWRSTYKDLGEWGQTTFRKNVPHKVSKTDVELPSIPPTAAGSRAMSEYAHRHANFQLGKTLQAPYQSKSKSTKPVVSWLCSHMLIITRSRSSLGCTDHCSKYTRTTRLNVSLFPPIFIT